jgi:1-deoxy-D-xylulose-5-phosphate reductoisomerase
MQSISPPSVPIGHPQQPFHAGRVIGGVRRISVLGATGSIGTSTLDLVARHRDAFAVEALVSGRDAEGLAALARTFRPRFVALADAAAGPALAAALEGTGIASGAGPQAVMEAASRPVDLVVSAITGAAGLAPTLAAIEAGSVIALANKEALVCAGSIVVAAALRKGVPILPVDSEHNAIFQALNGSDLDAVETIILTASGGPFRTWTAERIAQVTPEQALKHPNWTMGAKVTIDSATLMNKGLELIEASHLFDVGPERLRAVVHPQSIIHGMVAYRDGSVMAQLGAPDMRTPISVCLAYPARIETPVQRLNWATVGTLTFEEPDLERFPALGLAIAAMQRGGPAPAVLNAANEVAVAAFLERRLPFMGIPALVQATLDAFEGRNWPTDVSDLSTIFEIDRISRSLATDRIPRLATMAS